jgi:hypothetical protein
MLYAHLSDSIFRSEEPEAPAPPNGADLSEKLSAALTLKRLKAGNAAKKGKHAMSNNMKILEAFYIALESHDWSGARAHS